MVAVTLERIGKRFGKQEVLHDVSLKIEDGSFVAFVGPSGCGKSTLLRVIAGLETADAGDVRFGAERMNDVPAPERGTAMVFQSYALYPHMTVWENMSFSLRLTGVGKAERRRRAQEVAELLQMTDYLDRRPAELSGGQRQRVAIGRAILRRPRVFLFDEPLSNLDASLRADMRVELTRLHRQTGNTMIYVTHDQVEAMTMADRIVVLNKGRIVQVGAPMELYSTPASRFVAEFIGSPRMNIFEGVVDAAGETVGFAEDARIALPGRNLPAGATVALGLRPECLELLPEGAAEAVLPAVVDLVEHLGDVALVHCHGPLPGHILAKVDGSTGLASGDRVSIGFDAAAVHVFAADGMRVV